MSKLSDVVKNDVKKQIIRAKIKKTEDEIPDISNQVNNTTPIDKINKVKGEIPKTNTAGVAYERDFDDEIKNFI